MFFHGQRSKFTIDFVRDEHKFSNLFSEQLSEGKEFYSMSKIVSELEKERANTSVNE